MGVKPGDMVDIAEAVRHVHLLANKPFRSLASSELYKHLRLAPDWSKPKGLKHDLEAIHPWFKSLAIEQALERLSQL